MVTVTGVTADHIQELEDAGIKAAGLDANGHLILTKNDDSTIDAGSIQSPAGSVQMFAGATVPSGWLLCNGQAVSRTVYSNLFAAIGTTYGAGNGTTTFNVPNMETKIPRMEVANRGAAGGASSHTHTSNHDHAVDGGSTAAHAQIVFASSGPPAGRQSRITVPGWTETHEFTATGASVTAATQTGISNGIKLAGETAPATPTTSSTSSLPPYLNLNFIIKV